MRALSETYAGRADLEVEPVQKLDADFASREFPDSKHGLVAYGADGSILAKIEGHQFGKSEIEELVDGVLD